MVQQVNKTLSSAPCVTCERKGCGSYHDECEEYQAFREYRRRISDNRQVSEKLTSYKNEAMDRMKKTNRNTAKIFKSPRK